MNAFIFHSTIRTCSMKPLSNELGIDDNLPIVDGCISYYYQYSHQTYILIIINSLYISTMHHNVIPLFSMREGGEIINNIPKIHCNDPRSNDHYISFERNDSKTPMKFSVTFSYFYFLLSYVKEIQDCYKLFITPGSDDWKPPLRIY